MKAKLLSSETEVKEVVRIIRSGSLPREVVDLLASSPRWSKEYGVQVELVKSPKTPAFLSLRLLRHLYRHDLARVARDVNLPVNVRQQADNLLQTRLGSLGIGDRIALAKSGSNAIAGALLYDKDLEVVAAALHNQRVTEKDLYPLINNRKTHPEVLEMIGTHLKWARRYKVRLGLLRHPRTPVYVAYELLENVMAQDLRDLTVAENIPRLVRKRAQTILDRKVISLEPEERRQLAEYGKGANLDALARNGTVEEAARMLKNPELTMYQYRQLFLRHRDTDLLPWLQQHSYWSKLPKRDRANAEPPPQDNSPEQP